MKNIIIIILLLSTIALQAQTVTNCKDDPQLLAYQDSLAKWQSVQQWKNALIQKLDNTQTLSEFDSVLDANGFNVFKKFKSVASGNEKAVDLGEKPNIVYTKLGTWVFKNSIRTVVKEPYYINYPKPRNEVVFREYVPKDEHIEKNHVVETKAEQKTTIVWQTKKLNGVINVDSSIIIIK